MRDLKREVSSLRWCRAFAAPAIAVAITAVAPYAFSAPALPDPAEGFGIGNGVLRLEAVRRISRLTERLRRGGSVIGPGAGSLNGSCGTDGTIADRTQDCAEAYDAESARLAPAGATCAVRRGAPPCRPFRWILVSVANDLSQVWLDEESGRLWTFGSETPVSFDQGERFCREQSADLGGEVSLGLPGRGEFSEARIHGIQSILPGFSDRYFWTSSLDLLPGVAIMEPYRLVINLITDAVTPAPKSWSNVVWARCASVASGAAAGSFAGEGVTPLARPFAR